MKRIMKLTILLSLAAGFSVAGSFSITYYVQANVDLRTQPYSTDWVAVSGTEMAPAIQCLCIITDIDVYVDPYSGTQTTVTNSSSWQAVNPRAAFIIGFELPMGRSVTVMKSWRGPVRPGWRLRSISRRCSHCQA
jgi:hypothetical protein